MYYTISGYENAETVKVFATSEERDEFVERCLNDTSIHYTLVNCRPATRAEAIKLVGKESFEYHLKEYEYSLTQ